METVKIDMQRLQLLNDRIAQTIDALNQLRLTVHGIQHTPATVNPWGGYPTGYGPQFVQPTSFGYNPGQFGGFVGGGYSNGFSHTSWEPQWQPHITPTFPRWY